MFNKEKIKGFVSGFTVAILICLLTVSAFASPVRKSIEVMYNDIKLVVDGQRVQFGRDSVGNQIQPFIYNGTTYLPVKAVGEALNKNVEWDGQTQTVYIGKKTLFEEEVVFIGNGIDHMSFEMNRGNKSNLKYEYNITMPVEDNIRNKYNNYLFIPIESYSIWGADRYNAWSKIDFPLNAGYKEFKATLGIPNNYKDEFGTKDIKIYADDRLVYEKTLKQGDMPEEITVNVAGALKLTIQITTDDGTTRKDVGFFNARLTK
ncbi:hypothetical protein Amet_3565 [Alkaliphilus metalliredigens QYMF]|uniref:Copper amine oxidase domain protein n=1 Tax=Alkaliphilus metalliredigens (strain QYMF) TaxID=293826 RepID=A6TU19_ALKMQ|nr:stalk domain-containing protein [Alkaliphilus metalliredigens]ABR49687.1 hypothetical protein Amet_3565 [Alkaliphilus metalliredigens QYMF]